MNERDQAAAGHLLGIGLEIADLLEDLNGVLSHARGDSWKAASDRRLLHRWSNVAPETRSALLLNLAWGSRGGKLTVGEDTAGLYASELHEYASAFDGDSKAYHGSGYPAMPLPGQAGTLASSLGFDRDGLPVSLRTALILLATTHVSTPFE
mgnify:CR=1 FL=1